MLNLAGHELTGNVNEQIQLLQSIISANGSLLGRKQNTRTNTVNIAYSVFDRLIQCCTVQQVPLSRNLLTNNDMCLLSAAQTSKLLSTSVDRLKQLLERYFVLLIAGETVSSRY